MRSRKVRFVVKLALLVSIMSLSGGALPAQNIPWGTYHKDMLRSGQNTLSTDIVDPTGLNLIWVFPRAIDTAGANSAGIVDDSVFPSPLPLGWNWGGTSSSGTEVLWSSQTESSTGQLCFALAQSNPDINGNPVTGTTVSWPFPAGTLSTGESYQVFVWVPSSFDVNPYGYQPTTQAVYTVTDSSGNTTTVTFDQTSTGGGWRLLTTQSFGFNSSSSVQLSDVTGDTAASLSDDVTNGTSNHCCRRCGRVRPEQL